MPRLTKADLLARIAQLESELGLSEQRVHELACEVDAFHYTERPSRERSEHPTAPSTPTKAATSIITIGGERFAKVVGWEGGRKVTTYKPLAAH